LHNRIKSLVVPRESAESARQDFLEWGTEQSWKPISVYRETASKFAAERGNNATPVGVQMNGLRIVRNWAESTPTMFRPLSRNGLRLS